MRRETSRKVSPESSQPHFAKLVPLTEFALRIPVPNAKPTEYRVNTAGRVANHISPAKRLRSNHRESHNIAALLPVR